MRMTRKEDGEFADAAVIQIVGGEKQMAKDLVCGMEVDEKTARYKTEHEGKTYYFCAPGCKRAFEDNPQKYIK